MNKNRGIIAKMRGKFIKSAVEKFSLMAFAEEKPEGNGEGSDPSNNQNVTTPTINYEDLIAKARKEEKEKQYKAIEKYKTQVKTLTEQHNQDLLKIAELEKQLTDLQANRNSSESETITTLRGTIDTLTKERDGLSDKVKTLEETKPVSREEIETEIRERLEAEYAVKTYKAEKLLELKNEILVPELVFGSTKEEIDDSIKAALDRSAEIRKSLGIDGSNKPTKRTPKSPSNPSISNVQDKGYSLEYLASLDVRSPEYAEVRKSLGLR